MGCRQRASRGLWLVTILLGEISFKWLRSCLGVIILRWTKNSRDSSPDIATRTIPPLLDPHGPFSLGNRKRDSFGTLLSPRTLPSSIVDLLDVNMRTACPSEIIFSALPMLPCMVTGARALANASEEFGTPSPCNNRISTGCHWGSATLKFLSNVFVVLRSHDEGLRRP